MKEVQFNSTPSPHGPMHFVYSGGPIQVESAEEGERIVEILREQGFHSAIAQSFGVEVSSSRSSAYLDLDVHVAPLD